MKNLLLFLFLMSTILSAQTTMEEFEYIKEDYKKALSNGMIAEKDGYHFEEIESFDYGDDKQVYNFVLTRMIHQEEGLKAIILSYYNKGELATFCIPHPETPDQIWISTIRDFNTYWVDKKRFPLFSSLFMKLMYLPETEF